MDIYREKPIKVSVKVLVPSKEHPKVRESSRRLGLQLALLLPRFTILPPFCLQFNFVGKLLGPKGNSLKRLQEETMTKMAVLGRGSMKDRTKVSDIHAALGPLSARALCRALGWGSCGRPSSSNFT